MSTPRSGAYDDGVVALDAAAITLRRYHFPSGTSKIVPLQTIRGYHVEPLGLLHRFRLWGTSDLRRWLPLDIQRPFRSTLITLDVPGTWPSPAFTPEHPEEFIDLLDALRRSLAPPSTAAALVPFDRREELRGRACT